MHLLILLNERGNQNYKLILFLPNMMSHWCHDYNDCFLKADMGLNMLIFIAILHLFLIIAYNLYFKVTDVDIIANIHLEEWLQFEVRSCTKDNILDDSLSYWLSWCFPIMHEFWAFKIAVYLYLLCFIVTYIRILWAHDQKWCWFSS